MTHGQKANFGLGFGMLTFFVGFVMLSDASAWAALAVVMLVGSGLSIWGCYSLAKLKGYHGAWALVGVLPLNGWAILLMLPDMTKLRGRRGRPPYYLAALLAAVWMGGAYALGVGNMVTDPVQQDIGIPLLEGLVLAGALSGLALAFWLLLEKSGWAKAYVVVGYVLGCALGVVLFFVLPFALYFMGGDMRRIPMEPRELSMAEKVLSQIAIQVYLPASVCLWASIGPMFGAAVGGWVGRAKDARVKERTAPPAL